MAFNDKSIYKSFIASASITAFQLVKFDNAGKVTPCTASTDVPVVFLNRLFQVVILSML